MKNEIIGILNKPEDRLDISLLKENLAVGAAPRSLGAIDSLLVLEFIHVIDLRAERKSSDVLAHTKEVSVSWVPTYDDWRPKPSDLFRQLTVTIEEILSLKDSGGLFICCGAGEHRAPLAGVVALVTMGHSLESAIEAVKKARPVAEILPVYKLSLNEFLRGNKNHV